MHYLRRLDCILYNYYIKLHLVKTNVMRINNTVEQNCFVILQFIFLLNLRVTLRAMHIRFVAYVKEN